MPKNQYDHETLEELDALIAERSRPENLPKWWKAEALKNGNVRVKPNGKPRQRWGKKGRPSQSKKGKSP